MSKGQRSSETNRADGAVGPRRSAGSSPLVPSTRREFFRQSASLAGLAVLVPGVLGTLAACHSDTLAPGVAATIDFSTDAGAINFAYAMFQLESDMYYRVTTYPYAGMLISEKNTLYGYFSATYTEANNIKKMSFGKRITDSVLFNYDSVNFLDRASSLGAVRAIAESTADGYAGLAALVTEPANVTLVTNWSTAAAARATAVRAMLSLGAYTPTAATPTAVLAALDPYYLTKFTLLDTGASA